MALLALLLALPLPSTTAASSNPLILTFLAVPARFAARSKAPRLLAVAQLLRFPLADLRLRLATERRNTVCELGRLDLKNFARFIGSVSVR